MEYVIKSKRLKEFLFLLGFEYRVKPNRLNQNECIYLFKNTDKLKKAISFYTEFRKNII